MEEGPAIHIKGARVHNLRNLELRLPRGRLIAVTGVSGSGKSSLAFDTLYAEGYRKFLDSLSTRARQVLEQVPRPEVDFIHGLGPVIAIEQRQSGAGPRATVASVTEVADYAKLLWARCGTPRCPLDGGAIEKRSLDDCLARLLALPQGKRFLLLAPFITAKPAVLRGEFPHLRQRGFQRVRIAGEVRDLDERDLLPAGREPMTVEIVVDRLVADPAQRSRMADSLELCFREGQDRAIVLVLGSSGLKEDEFVLSQSHACATCGQTYPEIGPKHLSPNHPDGACSSCGGLGQAMEFAPDLVVPDSSRSLRGGALAAWKCGPRKWVAERDALLRRLAPQIPCDLDQAWERLPEAVRTLLLHGSEDRFFAGASPDPKADAAAGTFGGVLHDLRATWESDPAEAFKARLVSFQRKSPCRACLGRKLNPLGSAVRLATTTLPEFLAMDLRAALELVESLPHALGEGVLLRDVWDGLRGRLSFLHRIGLGYLSLDREFDSLSGGESQRVRLATQLGMGLVGVTYVLDEPSIGLHAHDNARLINLLLELRDAGNTVVVVEHDADTLRTADWMVELGPGSGEKGGHLVFQGTPSEAMAGPTGSPVSESRPGDSRSGPYLAGRAKVLKSGRTLHPSGAWVTVHGATQHNLKSVDASFPIGLLTVVTGVSGSGKSTLVNEVLAKAASAQLNRSREVPGRHRRITGLEHLLSVVRVDQAPIGRSARSNPATYVKVFDELRALYARTSLAKVRGYGPNRFSFNTRGGRCERCQGEGLIRLDMQFLSDVHTVCPSCAGARYNRETLEVRYRGLSIAEVLELSVEEAYDVFRAHPKIVAKLETLRAVGLGYLRLGQRGSTLSGGEAQRVKLSLELSRRQQGRTLYLLDEPTTGLHWDDVQQLMDLLFRLRDAGNTIIIIEHNLDVVRLADWVIDLGPGGGREGGELLFSGPVAKLERAERSLTGRMLR